MRLRLIGLVIALSAIIGCDDMIINPDDSNNNSSFPNELRFRNELTNFKSIFLIKRGFAFNNVAQIQDEATFKQAIKENNIIPLLHVFEPSDNSDATNYISSNQGFEYKERDTLYKFTFKMHMPVRYAKNIDGIDGGNYDVMFADANNQLYARQDVNIRGFTTNNVSLESRSIGTGDGSFVEVKIDLADTMEIKRQLLVEPVSWSINEANIMQLVINNLQVYDVPPMMEFEVVDSYCEELITGLQLSNIFLDDNVGIVNPINLTEGAIGQYTAVFNPGTFGAGDLVVDTETQYGRASYNSTQPVDLTVIDTSEVTITFTALIGVTPVTDLLESEIIVTDPIAGDLTFTLANEGGGQYTMHSFSTLLSSGIITLTGTRYQGTTDYSTIKIDFVQKTRWDDPANESADILGTRMFAQVLNTAGIPITGLSSGSFSVVDNVDGALTISAFWEEANGVYELNFTGGKVHTGTLTINGQGYLATGDYTYIVNIHPVPNSGASGTTDWINPVGGVAENWTEEDLGDIMTPAVISGAPFTGNAQQITTSAEGGGLSNRLAQTISLTHPTHKFFVRFRGLATTGAIAVAIGYKDQVGGGTIVIQNTVEVADGYVYRYAGDSDGASLVPHEVQGVYINVVAGNPTIAGAADDIEVLELDLEDNIN